VARWSVHRGHDEPELGARAETQVIETIRRTMTEKVGVVRDAAGLGAALDLFEELARHPHDAATLNALTAARFVAAAALAREESRGGHYRSDFPKADPARARRTYLRLDDLKRGEPAVVATTEETPAP
jgi:L-aspartate oxidase